MVNRYLDDLAAKLPLRNKPASDGFSWRLARGANLVGAIAAAQPDAGKEAVVKLAQLLTRTAYGRTDQLPAAKRMF